MSSGINPAWYGGLDFFNGEVLDYFYGVLGTGVFKSLQMFAGDFIFIVEWLNKKSSLLHLRSFKHYLISLIVPYLDYLDALLLWWEV